MRTQPAAFVDTERRARRLVARTQTLFFVLLACCVVSDHSEVAQRDGISFYGVHAPTLALAVVAYVVASVGLWQFAHLLIDATGDRFVGAQLRVVAVVLVVLLITPYNRGALLNWTHMGAGVVGALAQLACAGRLAWRTTTTRSRAALVVMLVGGVVSALSLPNWHFAYLLDGEIILEIGFAWSLWEWTTQTSSSTRAFRAGPL
ncbi:MAG: hypothetical protein KGJ10_01730 [Acidobacteriota bacterium]|nr:hypothetical protein [Acidobacteriota bacterium]MDE3043530.1 hypothetical protein [Acidobacteriota bacterium]MDE3106633.1 hypothetical protein [Acidobacteriota bacterium]MDE3223371.1 hypothetical protein [Acidobacteriota bacterium]